jgi:hypothetical protein
LRAKKRRFAATTPEAIGLVGQLLDQIVTAARPKPLVRPVRDRWGPGARQRRELEDGNWKTV